MYSYLLFSSIKPNYYEKVINNINSTSDSLKFNGLEIKDSTVFPEHIAISFEGRVRLL